MSCIGSSGGMPTAGGFRAAAKGGEVLVTLRNGEAARLVRVLDASDLGGDVALGLDAFAPAFATCSEAELVHHFGADKDVRALYCRLIDEDDVVPFRAGHDIVWIRAMGTGAADGLMGYMTLKPVAHEEGSVFVSTLVISHEKQNQGVGRLLLNSIAEHWFPGTRGLRLEVRCINAGAIRFYERYGFEFAEEPGSDPRLRLMKKKVGLRVTGK